ncbi:unnamed protein product [Auanema sp. JU1783]|nr:unnamed protein product [Auanema sp. JU1783]
MANSNNNNSSLLVLVTGASGYIGSQCVKQLLEQGFRVRGTVRSLKNPKKVDPIKCLDKKGNLELVEADLLNAECWDRVLDGCDYVLHVASPFPIVADEKCIETAILGTLNVLKAAGQCDSVKKVVLTSSCAAVNEGHDDPAKMYDETTWTNVNSKQVDNYAKSKTLAEKAAWDFMKEDKHTNKFKLTAINPTFVVGPMLIDEQGASITVMRRFLNMEMPGFPQLNLACVDVRDVASAHIKAMTESATDGERILVTSQPSLWFRDFARVLGSEFREQGYWIPSIQVPYYVLWIYSFLDSQAAACLHRVGHTIRFDNSKAQNLLGITFRDPKESILSMAYSMIERGHIKKARNYTGVPDKYKDI